MSQPPAATTYKAADTQGDDGGDDHGGPAEPLWLPRLLLNWGWAIWGLRAAGWHALRRQGLELREGLSWWTGGYRTRTHEHHKSLVLHLGSEHHAKGFTSAIRTHRWLRGSLPLTNRLSRARAREASLSTPHLRSPELIERNSGHRGAFDGNTPP
jgi:hypothetical protein